MTLHECPGERANVARFHTTVSPAVGTSQWIIIPEQAPISGRVVRTEDLTAGVLSGPPSAGADPFITRYLISSPATPAPLMPPPSTMPSVFENDMPRLQLLYGEGDTRTVDTGGERPLDSATEMNLPDTA
ncbi:hypothetical protein [Catenuloplanes japonicus]|uniref:hypothetical protein n=1 Tax=Catenuloplanes japonicus TaxID=33876 RepID=UPI0012FB1AD9|nr:hypothetical protein [Catenuloplanes japonicus]